jgi:hypothetical protein
MAVDLIFRGGPVSLFATVGSVGSGLVQMVFRSHVNMMSSYIPATTHISLLDGKLQFKLSSEHTQLIPSGKGWANPNSTGQLFPRSKIRRT